METPKVNETCRLYKRPPEPTFLFSFNLAPYEPFKNFKYAGPLRAVYPLSPRRTVPDEIQKPDYTETGMCEKRRIVCYAKFLIF